MFLSWLRTLTRHAIREGRRTSKPAGRHATFRPRLAALEGRDVPSTLTVTNNLDSGKGSLRYEISQANTGDTIVFSLNQNKKGGTINGGTITLTGGELVISKSLTIQGPGAGLLTVSGGGASRVFEAAPNVTAAISGLTITAGNSGLLTDHIAEGGDILNLGALTLSGCTVSGGTTVSGDLFGNGGPGGDVCNLGVMTLSGCTISGGNAGFDGYGGGIYNGGTMTVSGGTVSGNVAADGGGIYNYSGCTLTISGCTIGGAGRGPNNIAEIGAGGGIFNDGNMTLTGCTLFNNSAWDLYGGRSGQYGGGIYNAGTATVSGCTLTGNSATSGGGIYNAGAAAALTVLDSIFSSNSPDNIFGPYTDGGGNSFS